MYLLVATILLWAFFAPDLGSIGKGIQRLAAQLAPLADRGKVETRLKQLQEISAGHGFSLDSPLAAQVYRDLDERVAARLETALSGSKIDATA
jgi:hypothetical protein